ncbi:uncharacterized protein [Musca autumnalis]|uniref:uncharacterized protein n=1 Tax=Musca autumnalis TaxID=221902 RepID=UPI003CEB439D
MSVKSTLKLFIAIACITLVLGASQNIPLPNALDKTSIARFLATSANAMQRNPTRSVTCSDYFLPAIECITKEFEKSNVKCTTTAEEARAAAEAETADDQAEFAQQADNSCGAVVECKNAADAEAKFQCYANNGSSGSKDLRTLSNNANSKSSKLNDKLRRIDREEESCITTNRFKYETDSDQAYQEFTDCIYGHSAVPTEPSHWCPEPETK